MRNISLWLRALLFYFGYHTTLFFFTVCRFLIVPFLSFKYRYWLLTRWNCFVVLWLKVCCDVHYRITGLENIPDKPCVILSNHQSPWETLYLQTVFSPLATIVKKELLDIPFFGWGLAALEPIAIDRTNPREALKQTLTEGKARLAAQRSLLVFPEGTRVSYGEHGKYARGGASIAKAAGVDILFVAHDAGKCWPAHKIIKHPGTIHVTISPAVDSSELSASELTAQARSWIGSTLENYKREQL